MRTTDEIYSALAADFSAASGAVIPEGGDMALRLKAVAAEIFSLEAQAEFLSRQCFPQTAAGEYLDRHAALRGLHRGSALFAAAGAIFVTTAAGTIPAGGTDCTVAAKAAAAGFGGNVPAAAVTCITLPPTGVEGVCNDAAFAGGTDGETDDALRARVLASYRTLPNGANAAYYESKLLELDNVAAVSVLPRNRGTGTVDVIFAGHSGVPTAAEVAAAQALLDSEREICVDIAVAAPETANVNITASLQVAAGFAFSDVKAAAEAALSGFFTGKRLSRAVYRAGLSALLMAVEGVENCTLTAPAADVAAALGVLPVLGTVSISEAV